MSKSRPFTVSEQRVIKALYSLERWATANEIAEWADNMSWNTASKVLENLHKSNIVEKKVINAKVQWKIKEFE